MDGPVVIDTTYGTRASVKYVYGGETGRVWQFRTTRAAHEFFWAFEERLRKPEVIAARMLYGYYPEMVERLRVAYHEEPAETVVGYAVDIVHPGGVVERRDPNRFQYRWERANLTLVLGVRVPFWDRLLRIWRRHWLFCVLLSQICGGRLANGGDFSSQRHFAVALFEESHPYNGTPFKELTDILGRNADRDSSWCLSVRWHKILWGLPRDYMDLLRGKLGVFDTPQPERAAGTTGVRVVDPRVAREDGGGGYILLNMNVD